jgi:hypothetical protein
VLLSLAERQFSAALVKADLKRTAKEAELGGIGSMAAWAIGCKLNLLSRTEPTLSKAALSSMEDKASADIAKEIFSCLNLPAGILRYARAQHLI